MSSRVATCHFLRTAHLYYVAGMLLWIIMALMTGAAVLAALCPLSRKMSARRSEEATDVAFYNDQVREIERDLGRGSITPSGADAARAEAGRRLLRARDGAGPPLVATGEPALRRRRAASAFALSVVPLVSLAVYGAVGSPGLAFLPPQQAETAGGGGVDLDAAMAQIQAHLAAHPEDLRGWDLVGPIYLRVGRPDDAAVAYRQALRLGGETADRLTGLGEALVAGANGIVGTDAVSTFGRALALDPAAPKPRFYVALAAEQDGDLDRARDGYGSLVRASPPDAPWLPLVQSRLSGLPGGGDAGGRQPVRPLGAVPPEVAAMVSSLDERLKTAGGSEPEWSRLVRSFVVLGQPAEAADRLVRAKVALATDRGATARLDQLASDLGLDAAGQKP